MPSPPTNQPALSVRDLRTYYHTDAGFVRAVDGVSFEVPPGGSVGIAGESGSGKTQTALSILGLIDDVPGIVDGQVWVDGENLLDGLGDFCFWEEKAEGVTITKDIERWRARHHRQLARVRGEKISMVFQEPKRSLIPYFTVGEHLRETMAARDGNDAARAYEEPALDLLKKLQFEDPRRVFGSYPHELSGGESQRVMLGLALLGRPHLLIADEPTSLLDAITERRVLETLTTLVQEMNLALLLIAHDLALVRVMVDQVAVMFAGKIVEWGPAAEIIQPTNERGHPYTQALLRAVPNTDEQPAPPSATLAPLDTRINTGGCRYYYRCGLKDVLPEAVRARCLNEEPPAFPVGDNHVAACWAREDAA